MNGRGAVKTAKPTKERLAWHEMEVGVLIRYCMEMHRPSVGLIAPAG